MVSVPGCLIPSPLRPDCHHPLTPLLLTRQLFPSFLKEEGNLDLPSTSFSSPHHPNSSPPSRPKPPLRLPVMFFKSSVLALLATQVFGALAQVRH